MKRKANDNGTHYVYTSEQGAIVLQTTKELRSLAFGLVRLLETIPQRKKREKRIFCAKLAIDRAIEYLENNS